ncbi:hypothetical protein B0H13DRAFT_2443190, partial [Mycena leptocephala]
SENADDDLATHASLQDDSWTRVTRRGDPGALNEAISLALEFASREIYSNHPAAPQNLPPDLETRSQAREESDDIDAMITLQRDAIASTWKDAELRDKLDILSQYLTLRYLNRGRSEDRIEAIAVVRTRLSLTSLLDQPGHLKNLKSLSMLCRKDDQRTGDVGDIDGKIDNQRQALSLGVSWDPERPTALQNLALTLGDRCKESGDWNDIDEIVQLQRKALGLTPEGHPDRASRLENFSLFLRDHYSIRGDLRYLAAALKCLRQGLDLTPQGHS